MKKKSMIIILTILMVISLVPITVFAADTPISTGGEYDLTSIGDDSVVTISTTDAVTLIQSSTGALTNLRVNCTVAGVNLTIKGIDIISDESAISFMGTGNSLVIEAESYAGAGIGGGYGAHGGTIIINGGVVLASAEGGAGIGGGAFGDGGTIKITGGYIDSVSVSDSAGIGGGYKGSSGNITITGGEVYAESTHTYDIGDGTDYSGTSGTLSIEGLSAVFLKNNSSIPVTTTTHALFTNETITSGEAYGYTVPASWSGTAYAYLTNTLVIDDAYIAASGSEYDISSDSYTNISIQTTQAVTISQSDASANTDMQITAAVDDVDLTIDGLNIDMSTSDGACALSFTGTGNTLTVSGTNSLTSGEDKAGISVNENAELTLTGDDTSVLNAQGGTYGAGIGGDEFEGAGTIIISSGEVNATSGLNGAGIGGGSSGFSGTIVINDGTVTAIGSGYEGAGIGGGLYGGAESITINGGTVSATGATYGAGIGSGYESDCESIVINDGNITAQGGDGGAGIGGGYRGDCTSVEIHGGTIDSTGGESAAGIGGSDSGNVDTLLMDGGTVTATGGAYAAGFGMGSNSTDNGSITVSGGVLNAIATSETAAGIGSGNNGSVGEIELSGGTIYAEGGTLCNDIGPGNSSSEGTITILSAAAVFLKNGNISPAPTTTTHEYYDTDTIVSNMAYGFYVPDTWSGTAYAYLCDYTVTYEEGTNGVFTAGSETEEEVRCGASPEDAPTVEPDATYELIGWSDGKTTSRDLDDFIIKQDTTLTAQYQAVAVNGVDIDESSITLVLDDGDTTNDIAQLTATVSPDDAQDQGVSWASADETVATVDAGGLVSAVSAGSATITVTTDDGGYTDKCTITVEQRVTLVTLNKSSLTLDIGEAETLICSVSPDDATDPSVLWESSDESVATVDSSGKVKGIGAGTATIKATADGKEVECVVTVEEETPEPTATSTPTPTETDSSGSTTEPTAKPSPSPQPSATEVADEATPTPSKETITPIMVIEDEESGTVTVTISVDDLPEGTTSIELPSGEIVEVKNADTIEIMIANDALSEDGALDIVALDSEGIPLASYDIQVADTVIELDTEPIVDSVWTVLIWICGIVLGGGVIVLVSYLMWKRRK